GTMGVVAAGTGLGEAYLHWVNGAHHPMATEGGHTEFGPRNELEDELLAFLRRDTGGHVSYERILSGPGVWNLYRFLRQRGELPESAAVAEAMLDSDPAAVIGAHAMEQGDPLCVRTLELFCEIYGAEAGNLALKGLTTGGIFVGGGIAPKIRPFMEGGAFMRGFLDKGRFRDTLAAMPVVLSLNARAPLLGAAYYGARLCAG
ncbi:MAG: glucokinase, partial [Gammaproteobacteria bacterium]